MLGWLTIGASLACACTIPVFRYALERWESDRFLVIVYCDSQLTEEQNSAITELAQRSSVLGGPLNIEVIRYDLASPAPLKLLDVQRPPVNQPLPWVEVRARTAETRTVVRWQGPLPEAIVQPGLFDSPARSEIVRRLLDGDSCVFLLVAPEDQVQRRSQELQTMLDSAPDGLALPQGIGLPGSELYAPIPLVIRFSVVPISHANPEEQPFLKLLAASAAEWRADTAYVIPVFGRGRALGVFPYAEADEPLIEDVGSFLCAACSCRVKQANPGFDLLVAVNWNQRLFDESVPPSRSAETQLNSAIGSSGQSGIAASSGQPSRAEYLMIPMGNRPAAATPNGNRSVEADRAVESEAAALGTRVGVTSFQPSRSTKKVFLLLIVLALIGGGMVAVAIFFRR